MTIIHSNDVILDEIFPHSDIRSLSVKENNYCQISRISLPDVYTLLMGEKKKNPLNKKIKKKNADIKEYIKKRCSHAFQWVLKEAY